MSAANASKSLVRELLVCVDVAAGEERDAREAEVLVLDEHADGHEVRRARVVDEARHVAEARRVQTVRIRLLQVEDDAKRLIYA